MFSVSLTCTGPTNEIMIKSFVIQKTSVLWPSSYYSIYGVQ